MNGAGESETSRALLERVHIVLVQPSHPGNIGAAARAMKTMGLSHLWLVNPKRFPDGEADARAAGAEDVLRAARVCASVDSALAATVYAGAVTARQRHLGPPALAARAAAEEVAAWAATGEVALLFGNETAGLANADVQRCRRTIYIPSDPGYASLNLAAAVQVLCYELRLAAFAGAPPCSTRAVPFASPPARHAEVEGLYTHLERVMIASGFLDPHQPRRLMAKLRRLFGRATLERDEINILRGVLDALERERSPVGEARDESASVPENSGQT
ncbi:MAG: RNA methyltransferase [Candidatus Accumulibacter sp.]|uniref:RNA methyltransferase n=1 Tax=Accumulibacter sp. TaxID=2053492 RepID=UPI00287AD86D|nr:RNA methyltransferase [Accumulibacter sp.]MDS4013343.1 RNA methyltransferase [Accumulibacter sp.]